MDASTVNMLGTALNASGSFMGAQNSSDYGAAAEAAALATAQQLRQRAGQVQASAQRAAFSVDREASYTASRALAVAAASGGGASDPTVVSLIAKNAGEFAYRRATALYNGEDEARTMNMKADVTEYEGKVKNQVARSEANAKMMQGGATLLKGYAKGSSLFERFGQDGPQSGQVNNSAGDIYTGNMG